MDTDHWVCFQSYSFFFVLAQPSVAMTYYAGATALWQFVRVEIRNEDSIF